MDSKSKTVEQVLRPIPNQIFGSLALICLGIAIVTSSFTFTAVGKNEMFKFVVYAGEVMMLLGCWNLSRVAKSFISALIMISERKDQA